MNNLTTRYFCRKFCACREGTRFALKFDTMRECYAALLEGAAGNKSADWAIWTITQKGVMSDRDLRLFAVKCTQRVQHLLTDERSIRALDVAERYANGNADAAELVDARDAAWEAVYDVARGAARRAFVAVYDARCAAAYSTTCADDCVIACADYASFNAACADYASFNAASAQAGSDTAGEATRDTAWDAERREQLKILAKFGNPFEEVGERLG